MQLLRTRPLIILAAILGAFVIMLLDTAGYLAPVEGVVQSTFRPVYITFTEARGAATEFAQTARDLRTLRQRNQELETLVGRLTVENLQLSEVAIENETLRSFFEFAQTNPTVDFRGGQIIARVIGEGAGLYSDIVQIDLGASHNIKPGMPVLTDRGLVGRIVEVYPSTSTILLLTDPKSSVNVNTQAARAPGTMSGRAGQDPLVDLIPPDVDLSVGEIVLTSGLGGNFPKGMVVGQVVEVLQSDSQLFQKAVIQPTVDFDRMELVLVVTSFTPLVEEPLEESSQDGEPTPESQ